MKKLFFLFFFCVSLSTLTFSQHIGFRAGLNRSIFNVSDNPDGTKFDKNFGFQIGVVYERPLTKILFINSGILFSTKGSGVEPRMEGLLNYKIKYFQIPINLMVKQELDDILLFVNAGPYFAYAVSGVIKGVNSTKLENFTRSIDFGNDETFFNRFDYGFNISLGVQLNKCQLSIGKDFGIADVRNLNYTITRNRSLQLTVCLFY